MPLTADEIATRYPIHWLVWNNRNEELKKALEANQYTADDIELRDPRGRTPLLLAVTLSNIDAVRVLIEANADVNCEKDGWTAVQEATATGDAELLSLVLCRRDYQRHVVRSSGIPDLLHRLSLAPDFYVEMKWEFTSWVPLVSRICPFDTYKVYKRGGNVRVDTTLIGFENNRWQRGDRTYIFRGQGRTASLVELDHELGTSWCEYLESAGDAREWPPTPQHIIQQRLSAPIAINYLDTDKISFERNKCGIWGWRQDKTESVNGYECKVFSANNVELVSKTRAEHLQHVPRDRRATRSPRPPLAGLMALVDTDRSASPTPPDTTSPLLTPDVGEVHSAVDVKYENRTAAKCPAGLETTGPPPANPSPLVKFEIPPSTTPPETDSLLSQVVEEPPKRSRSTEQLRPVTWYEYFGDEPLGERDIGRQKEITTKVQKFKATLWLSEDYPLELQEQIMPILDLMAAISSPHFAKLKDFIQMQLPAGFPVKIEIPLFHVLNARITFGNIFATESAVPHVECIAEGARLACVLDDACFAVGRAYRDAAAPDDRLAAGLDDEESLLQYAIQQSLMEAGTHDDQVDVWEALRGTRPASPAPRPPPSPTQLLAHEERQLQRAIEASLAISKGVGSAEASPAGSAEASPDGSDTELRAALRASAREHAARDRQLRDEQRALDEVLRLSLLDK